MFTDVLFENSVFRTKKLASRSPYNDNSIQNIKTRRRKFVRFESAVPLFLRSINPRGRDWG